MATDGWGSDYPAASNFITNRFTCDLLYHPRRGSATRIDAMIDRATQLQIGDPAAAGHLWAKIDRAIVDQAPYCGSSIRSPSSSSPSAWATTSGAFSGAPAQSALGPLALPVLPQPGMHAPVNTWSRSRLHPTVLSGTPVTADPHVSRIVAGHGVASIL